MTMPPEPDMDDFEVEEPFGKSLFDLKAEQALLGAMLIDPGAINRIEISEDDFGSARHAQIYSAIRASAVPDFILVQEKLSERNQLGQIGGPAYLMEIINLSPSSLYSEHYADQVKSYAKRRKVVDLASKLASVAYKSNGEEFETKLSALSALFYALNTQAGKDTVHVRELLSKLYDEIEKAHEDPHDIWGMETGFRGWDKILGGHQKQELLMFTGEPSIGKSIFTTDLAFGLAEHGHPGVIYEMEMTDRQMLTRKISGYSGVEANKLKSGRFRDEDWPLLVDSMEKIEGLPIYVSDRSSWTVTGMKSDIMRLQEIAGVEWVVVDYLHYLTDHMDLKEHERLGENARALKILSRELNINMIVINSMTKQGMDDPEARSTGFRGSAQIVFDCDMGIFLKKDKDFKTNNIVNVTFSKYREGDSRRVYRIKMVPGIPSFKEVMELP